MIGAEQEERQVLPPNPEVSGNAAVGAGTGTHGIELAVEFKPLEHPIEPMDSDPPIECPLPEPSILNVSFSSLLFSFTVSNILCYSKRIYCLG